MSADKTPEFSGWTGEGQSGADPSGPVTDADRPDDIRPADAEVEENTTPDESRDPDHGYDPTKESGSENAPVDESSAAEEENLLLPPGSTADGAGTSLGGVPDEARSGAEPLGQGEGTAKESQLADERWRTNGINPLG